MVRSPQFAHFQGKEWSFGVLMSLFMRVHDHYAGVIQVGLLFEHQLNEQTLREIIHGENYAKPHVARVASFSLLNPFSELLFRLDRPGVFGHMLFERLFDGLRSQTVEIPVGTDSVGGFLVPQATIAKAARDGLADKLHLGFLIHWPPLNWILRLAHAVSQKKTQVGLTAALIEAIFALHHIPTIASVSFLAEILYHHKAVSTYHQTSIGV
jgi:hypothetical protein